MIISLRNKLKNYLLYNRVSLINPLYNKYGIEYSLLESVTKTYPLYYAKHHFMMKYNPNYEIKYLSKHLDELKDFNPIWYENIIKSSSNAHNAIIQQYILEY